MSQTKTLVKTNTLKLSDPMTENNSSKYVTIETAEKYAQAREEQVIDYFVPIVNNQVQEIDKARRKAVEEHQKRKEAEAKLSNTIKPEIVTGGLEGKINIKNLSCKLNGRLASDDRELKKLFDKIYE